MQLSCMRLGISADGMYSDAMLKNCIMCIVLATLWNFTICIIFCGKSFQAPVNYVIKTIWAEVDSIDRRVGKKDSFTNHFPSEILKQIFIKQLQHTK